MKQAEIILASGVALQIELYDDVAPKTVENFLTLAAKGFYDGLTFHRVSKDLLPAGAAAHKAPAQVDLVIRFLVKNNQQSTPTFTRVIVHGACWKRHGRQPILLCHVQATTSRRCVHGWSLDK